MGIGGGRVADRDSLHVGPDRLVSRARPRAAFCRERRRRGRGPDVGRARARTATGGSARPVPALRHGARGVRATPPGPGSGGGRAAGLAAGIVRVRVVLSRPCVAAPERHRIRLRISDRCGACGTGRIALGGAPPGPRMNHEIREVHELEDLRALAELFAVVWGRPGEPPISSDILKALVHSGNYISCAFSDGRLIGGLVGWLGGDPRHELHMHSHILGVLPDDEARGLGFELKQHQRSWCLARGVNVMEWTTDPLIRRNAYFNLAKLGAEAPRYLVDFYGEMRDGINAGEESDRLLIRWHLDSSRAEAAAAGRLGELDVDKLRTWGSAAVVSVGAGGEPVEAASSARVLICQVPEDIVELRRKDPALARRWRVALRSAIAGAMERGYSISGATRAGWYVLESVTE